MNKRLNEKDTVVTSQVQLDAISYAYQLTRKNVKNINLKIRQDGLIVLSAHKNVPIGLIEDFIKKVICEKKDLFASIPSKKSHQTGDVFRLLGKEYELEIQHSQTDMVKLGDRTITLHTTDPLDKTLRKKTFDKFLKAYCRSIFLPIIDDYYPKFKKYIGITPRVTVRKMDSRWGSCRPLKKAITLNTRLIEAPIECVEYVIVHEYVHFIHADHSKDFYKSLAFYMPDWESHKKILDSEYYFEFN